MRVLVCGGRDYDDEKTVSRVLSELPRDGLSVAQGGATGADNLALEWCRANKIPVGTYWANWKDEGRSAGPIRNRKMLADFKPDLVIAFPGGAGTAHMVSIARRAGIKVMEID